MYPGRTGQWAITAAAMQAMPIAPKTAPMARENRAVVAIFSAAMMKPSAAIQITFITPTANMTSIMAQQQPTQ
jgi:hypothetical protein